MMDVLSECDLIVWDEVTMSPLSVIERVLRTAKKREEEPFGGCLVLFSGDFRQCLPIVKGNPTRLEVFQRCILSAPFYDKIVFLAMTENMRILSSNPSPEELTVLRQQLQYLWDIGSGFNVASGRGVENLNILTHSMHAFHPSGNNWVENFIRRIYPAHKLLLCGNLATDETAFDQVIDMLKGNCILTPTNAFVNSLNDKLISELHTPLFHSEALDQPINRRPFSEEIPAENTLIKKMKKFSDPGFPTYSLDLKVGAPIVHLMGWLVARFWSLLKSLMRTGLFVFSARL